MYLGLRQERSALLLRMLATPILLRSTRRFLKGAAADGIPDTKDLRR